MSKRIPERFNKYPDICWNCARPMKSRTCKCGVSYAVKVKKKKRNLGSAALPTVREANPNHLAKEFRG